jgi:hypothetical protein
VATTLNSDGLRRSLWLAAALSLLGAGMVPVPAAAQEPAPARYYLAEELEELVAPVALYPDDLLAIVLPAATYPLQVVEAARYLEKLRPGAKVEPDPEWDDSIVALLNYPDALALLNEDLDWTWRLGEAVLNQQSEVLAAVASFREDAYLAGNLETDDRQVVTRSSRAISIVPADPEVIYVPYYEPARVVVRHSYPVYHYHPRPCPLYYYPYGPDHWFRSGYFWGVSAAYRLSWTNWHLYVYPYWDVRHPWYGFAYRGDHWRNSRPRPYFVSRDRPDDDHPRWRPGAGHGARPPAQAPSRPERRSEPARDTRLGADRQAQTFAPELGANEPLPERAERRAAREAREAREAPRSARADSQPVQDARRPSRAVEAATLRVAREDGVSRRVSASGVRRAPEVIRAPSGRSSAPVQSAPRGASAASRPVVSRPSPSRPAVSRPSPPRPAAAPRGDTRQATAPARRSSSRFESFSSPSARGSVSSRSNGNVRSGPK